MPSADALMASVANSDDSAYLLTSEFQIVTVNAAFFRFAEANGGSQLLDKLGTAPIFAAMSQPLRQFYLDAFAHVQAAGQPWEHAGRPPAAPSTGPCPLAPQNHTT